MGRDDSELYVYAVADPGLPARLRVRGRLLRTVSVGRIAAVVEAARGSREATPEALREQHAVVVALARRSRAVLPARYGTRLTPAALRAAIVEHRETLAAALDRVRQRAQMTIRVFGPPDATRPRDARAPGGAAYLRSRRNRLHHLPPEIAAVRRALGRFTVAERAEAGSRSLRLTVFHLVADDAIGEYRDQASALQSTLAPLQVTVTGPWPPFAFSPELFR